jgi:type II secretory pathway pseudopilin PulG
MTLIELTVSTVIVGVLATVSYATISPKLKEDAQITEAKAYIREFAYQNQEAILKGEEINSLPDSQNFGYSVAPINGEKFIIASHRDSNAQVFGLLKNSGQIIICKDDPELCLNN